MCDPSRSRVFLLWGIALLLPSLCAFADDSQTHRDSQTPQSITTSNSTNQGSITSLTPERDRQKKDFLDGLQKATTNEELEKILQNAAPETLKDAKTDLEKELGALDPNSLDEETEKKRGELQITINKLNGRLNPSPKSPQNTSAPFSEVKPYRAPESLSKDSLISEFQKQFPGKDPKDIISPKFADELKKLSPETRSVLLDQARHAEGKMEFLMTLEAVLAKNPENIGDFILINKIPELSLSQLKEIQATAGEDQKGLKEAVRNEILKRWVALPSSERNVALLSIRQGKTDGFDRSDLKDIASFLENTRHRSVDEELAFLRAKYPDAAPSLFAAQEYNLKNPSPHSGEIAAFFGRALENKNANEQGWREFEAEEERNQKDPQARKEFQNQFVPKTGASLVRDEIAKTKVFDEIRKKTGISLDELRSNFDVYVAGKDIQLGFKQGVTGENKKEMANKFVGSIESQLVDAYSNHFGVTKEVIEQNFHSTVGMKDGKISVRLEINRDSEMLGLQQAQTLSFGSFINGNDMTLTLGNNHLDLTTPERMALWSKFKAINPQDPRWNETLKTGKTSESGLAQSSQDFALPISAFKSISEVGIKAAIAQAIKSVPSSAISGALVTGDLHFIGQLAAAADGLEADFSLEGFLKALGQGAVLGPYFHNVPLAGAKATVEQFAEGLGSAEKGNYFSAIYNFAAAFGPSLMKKGESEIGAPDRKANENRANKARQVLGDERYNQIKLGFEENHKGIKFEDELQRIHEITREGEQAQNIAKGLAARSLGLRSDEIRLLMQKGNEVFGADFDKDGNIVDSKGKQISDEAKSTKGKNPQEILSSYTDARKTLNDTVKKLAQQESVSPDDLEGLRKQFIEAGELRKDFVAATNSSPVPKEFDPALTKEYEDLLKKASEHKDLADKIEDLRKTSKGLAQAERDAEREYEKALRTKDPAAIQSAAENLRKILLEHDVHQDSIGWLRLVRDLGSEIAKGNYKIDGVESQRDYHARKGDGLQNFSEHQPIFYVEVTGKNVEMVRGFGSESPGDLPSFASSHYAGTEPWIAKMFGGYWSFDDNSHPAGPEIYSSSKTNMKGLALPASTKPGELSLNDQGQFVRVVVPQGSHWAAGITGPLRPEGADLFGNVVDPKTGTAYTTGNIMGTGSSGGRPQLTPLSPNFEIPTTTGKELAPEQHFLEPTDVKRVTHNSETGNNYKAPEEIRRLVLDFQRDASALAKELRQANPDYRYFTDKEGTRADGFKNYPEELRSKYNELVDQYKNSINTYQKWLENEGSKTLTPEEQKTYRDALRKDVVEQWSDLQDLRPSGTAISPNPFSEKSGPTVVDQILSAVNKKNSENPTTTDNSVIHNMVDKLVNVISLDLPNSKGTQGHETQPPIAIAPKTGPPEKVGFFTGTFDPPTHAHLDVVNRAIASQDLSRVYVVPNLDPSHKPNALSFDTRYEMLKAAVGENPKYVLPPKEVLKEVLADGGQGREKLIKWLNENHAGARLFQISGEDSFGRNPSTAQDRDFIVVRRPGSETEKPAGANVHFLDEDPKFKDYSSTHFRENPAANASMVPSPVLNYILQNHLYGTDNRALSDSDIGVINVLFDLTLYQLKQDEGTAAVQRSKIRQPSAARR